MRNAFFAALLAGATLAIPTTDAVASGARPKHIKSVKQTAFNKAPASPVGDCTPEKKEGRVRADVLFDMDDGTIVSSTLFDTKTGDVLKTNLTDDDMKKTVIHPASLTKLESVMELMRRIMSGEWAKDTVIKFFFKKKQPTNLTLTDIAVASLNPSANVMDHPSIATPDFIASMNAYMKSKGMLNTTYLNATGYPTNQEVRKGHLTTLHDLIIGIRDFELNYATPEKVKEVFGLDKLTGLWKINVPGLKRVQHTISVLETAEGKAAHPIEGVVSGKSGTTCNFGSGAYLTYQFNKDHTFGLLTIGHNSGAARDAYIRSSFETQKTAMADFIRHSKPIQKIEPLPLQTKLPIPEAVTALAPLHQ